MMETTFKKIAQHYWLGNFLSSPEIIKENRLWRLNTERGFFALKKLYIHAEPQQPLLGDDIARSLLRHNVPAVCACQTNTQEVIVCIDGAKYMLFPWHSAQPLEENQITVSHARQIGMLLGQIHRANIFLPHIPKAAWQQFVAPHWQMLIEEAGKKNLIWYGPACQALTSLKLWTERYGMAYQQCADLQVISHGDLTAGNILWQGEDTFFIIDWDTAGWIHPYIELLGVACNWAGMAYAPLNQRLFCSLLDGYRQAHPNLPAFSETILYAGLGSWLAWLSYCMGQSLMGEAGLMWEVVNTLQAIYRFTEHYPDIIQWSQVE